MPKLEKKTLLKLSNVSKKYEQKNSVITILDDINIEVKEGEILGIIGRSGSGKSSTLRIMSGLIEPSSGSVEYHDKSIINQVANTAMVFQTFGLVPWLNVFDNVTIGLDRKKYSKEEIQKKADKVIHLVGLKGYERAYPKVMSGGMRQRVGFARALIVDPEILLMDEPFSALDYITSNALKTDLLDLWFERNILSIKSIVLVTHSIEEAVKLSDRVIVLSSNPGKIIDNVMIDIAHPRDSTSTEFRDLVAKLYTILTNRKHAENEQYNLHKLYPQFINGFNLIHFLEIFRNKYQNNSVKISELTNFATLENGKILPYLDSLHLLRFIEIEGDVVRLSSSGNILIDADELSRKKIFQEHIVANVSIINTIYHDLISNKDKILQKQDILDILEQKFNHAEAFEIFKATISWLRFANLGVYNDVREELALNTREIS